MRWLSRWRASGREADALRAADEALARGDRELAWRRALEAIVERGSPLALRTVARIARARGDEAIAIRIDRAADDPADGSRAAECAGALGEARALPAAIAVLERALAVAPFDAVLRSELAVLLARAARPAESAACLALHPCLADDPGALFQFAWSSLLAGDAGAARGCLATLARAHPELARVLEEALARDATLPAGARTLRDWAFVEHGAILLRDGAHALADPDDAELVPALAVALQALGVATPRVVPATDSDDDLAASIASALAIDRARPARAGIPAGVLVARDARALAALEDRIGEEVITFASWLPIDEPAPVPDVIGAIAHRAGEGGAIDAAAVRAFVTPRRHLRRTGRPRRFVPDAPIAWP